MVKIESIPEYCKTTEKAYPDNFLVIADPRQKEPAPPKRHPQDIDAYFNKLFAELEDAYRRRFNQAPPEGLFEKSKMG